MYRFALLTVVFLGACGAPPPAAVPTWHRDIAPMFERSCSGCHQAGGIAPFTLDTLADVAGLAEAHFGAGKGLSGCLLSSPPTTAASTSMTRR